MSASTDWPLDFEDWPLIGLPKPPIKIDKSGLMETASRCVTGGLRFRILTRDRYTCQYCGRSAPTVELRVDHVHPWAKGGKSREDNLVTACHECNAGKRDKVLEFNWPPYIRFQQPVLHINHDRHEETRVLIKVVDADHIAFQRDIRYQSAMGLADVTSECHQDNGPDRRLDEELDELEELEMQEHG